MEELKNGLLTRRQALSAMAAATAGAVIRPVPVFGASATKKLRFALLGDWGTGDNACAGIANQMYQTHLASALDFVIAAGDNLYPDGGGRQRVGG